ncbi:hypothetical protein DFAR_2760003 [Desulfarculales bacterium]
MGPKNIMTMGLLAEQVFRIFLLDGGGRVTATDDLFSVTLDQSGMYPR